MGRIRCFLSGVLKLHFLNSPRFDIEDCNLFDSVVKFAFVQRRKMLRNSLRCLITNGKEESLSNWEERSGIDFNKRPEQLYIEEFVRLGNVLYSLRENRNE